MSESDQTQFKIRIYLPNGYTCTLQLFGKCTFGELRNQCWDKKSKDFGCAKNEARFRLYTTELFFNDKQTISHLVSIYPSFEALGTIDRYSLLLECPSERGDKSMRQRMKIDTKKPIFWQGYLLKCSKPTGKGFWKKQYVIFQNQTLMLHASQDEFTKGKKAHKYIAMGSIVPLLDHHSCKTANKKWPLVLDVPQGKGTKAGIYVFAGDSQAVRQSFIDAIRKFLFYRKCSVILNILPCLYLNSYASTEGIFRIAGESTKIHSLQSDIDDGNIPNFFDLISDNTLHSVIGLLKRQLRFMLDPIIPETHYEAFIDIGRQLDENKRCEQLCFVIKSLSQTSVVVLCELFRFLSFAKDFESKSKMGPINFSIVIGPNILRTEAEIGNPMKAIDDNKHMQTTISTMISHFEKILPSKQDLYKFDKATNPKWKYGVIGAGNDHNLENNKHRQSGLFDMAHDFGMAHHSGHVNGTSSPVLGSPEFISFSASLGALNEQKKSKKAVPMELKSTHSDKQPNIAPSNTQTVDFRAVLRQKSNKKYSKSGTLNLQQPFSKKDNDDKKENNLKNNMNSNVMSSPKLPPPNPIEVMSTEQKQRQKENTHILEVFGDFEENMAQYDEEIDFKQSFAESIVSQIMELAENNKIVSAPKYAKKIEEKCRFVINAAKAHSQALQQFNQMLQNIYSQMEDEEENNGNEDFNLASPANQKSAHLTAGGNGNGDDNEQNEYEEEDTFDADESNFKLSKQGSYDTKAIRSPVGGGLPKYVSMTDMSQKDEPKKKYAKALFDYPGGYRSNELTFHRGTSLIITKEKEGWVYGCYELEPSLTGWFPKSYVKIISG